MEITVRIPQDINKFCRTCLQVTDDNFFFNRLIQDKGVTNLSTIFESVTSLKIVVGDGLPESICDDCYESLVEFYAFKNRCHDLEKKFKSILEKCSTNASKNDAENIQDTTEDPDTINQIIISNHEDLVCKCKHCDSIFPSYYLLSRHMCEHNATKTILERFLENSIEEEATVSEFNESDTLQLIAIRKLNNRKEVVVNESVKEKISVDQSAVTNIVAKRHPIAQQNFPCSFCDKKFSSEVDFLNHKLTHLELKYNCEQCQMSFYTQEAYNTHSKLNHGTKYICHMCNKTLHSKGDLKLHIENLHLSNQTQTCAQSHECEICGKNFKAASSLKFHIRTTHNSTSKKYVCSYCDYSSHYHSSHKVHMRTHTLEKPYNCTFGNCKKSFVSSSHRSTHMKFHLNIRPHKCSVCFSSFTSNSALKAHNMRQHSEERPQYCCSLCSKTFLRKDSLKIHKERKHGI